MVREVTAFASDDGQLFATEWEALQHDARKKLGKNFDKEEMINLIVNCRELIFSALRPLVEYEEAAAKRQDDATRELIENQG
jgi:hypothetical protein